MNPYSHFQIETLLVKYFVICKRKEHRSFLFFVTLIFSLILPVRVQIPVLFSHLLIINNPAESAQIANTTTLQFHLVP